jgi:N-acetylglucosamine-6-phosphate deacetylase
MIKKNNDQLILDGIHYLSNRPVRILIKDDVILSISEYFGSDKNTDLPFVAPGLIDNQVNGYAGIDFADEQITGERLRIATEAAWCEGVTTFLPTLVTNSYENLTRNFRILSEAADDPFFRGSIPGFHLEGPWLSPEEGFYGCHPVQYLRKPSWEEFTEYQEAAKGKIMVVTLAPELEDAQEFIRLCSEEGIIVAIGHTNATTEQINTAVANGARLATHLGNGCANLINRHRNPLWPQLANDLLTISVIADGQHLLDEELKVFYKAKGQDKIILVSDVTCLAGMDPGEYTYLGSRVVLNDEGLAMNPELNCLAGATFPLRKGIGTMMAATGCTLGQAVNMASGNVACLLGLNDRGKLAPGKRADIILFDMAGGLMDIKTVFVAGKNVYNKHISE